MTEEVKNMNQKIKDTVSKVANKTPLKDTVLLKRMESKTPKAWKVVGTAAKGMIAIGSIAYGFTPAGWFTYGAIGLFALGILTGTIAGYQTDDQELKGLWKKPFALLKKLKRK